MDDLDKYKGNSNSDKPKPTLPNDIKKAERKKAKRVVSVPPTESKPTLGGRVKALFVGEDARSVGAYLLIDVVVPAAKDLIFDIFTEGASRTLYGDSSGRSSRTGNPPWKAHTPYNKVSSRSRQAREPERRVDRRDRAVHDFTNLRFRDAGEAERVIDNLAELIAEYGVATVNDFYDSLGLTGEFVDDSHGWDNLRGSTVRRMRDGYMINLPPTKPID